MSFVYRHQFNYRPRRWWIGTSGGAVVVTPTTASLALTAYAPTVLTPITIIPLFSSLTLTTYAPTVSTPVVVTPTTASLVLTVFVPSVLTPVTVTPGLISLVLSTFVPTVSVAVPPSVQVVIPSGSLLLAPVEKRKRKPRTPQVLYLSPDPVFFDVTTDSNNLSLEIFLIIRLYVNFDVTGNLNSLSSLYMRCESLLDFRCRDFHLSYEIEDLKILGLIDEEEESLLGVL